MRLGIRWRIALPYMAVVLLSTLALTLYLSHQLRGRLMEQYRARLLAQAQVVHLFLRQPSTAQANLQSLAADWASQIDTRVTLIARDGAVLADSQSDPATMDNHRDRPEVAAALIEGWGASSRYSATTGSDTLYVALDAGPSAGLPVVRVAISLQAVGEEVAALRRILVSGALVIALAVAGLSSLLADRLTRPLRRLTEQVRAHQPPAAGLALEGFDEVRSLAAAYSGLTDELARRVEALAQERNEVSLVLAHLDDGVVITDAAGAVRWANPAALRLLSLRDGAANGRPLLEVVSTPDVIALWQTGRQTGEQQETIIEAPGRAAFMRLVVSPLPGSPAGGEMLLLQDLTQVRRLETIRRDFISNISHELRTPLASLKALVETLQDGALEDPAVSGNFLRRMEIEVDSLTQMVQELLELSRIESGQVPLRLAPISLEQLLAEPLDRLRPQAERAELRFAVNLPTEPITVLADADRVRQVIANLVHNAVKFTPAGGRVSISAMRVRHEAVISVYDTGIGIPAKDLPRIFERFYKADRARAGGGTGLGLAIAKHIVQAHGGRIWAESDEATGSVLRFTLPLA